MPTLDHSTKLLKKIQEIKMMYAMGEYQNIDMAFIACAQAGLEAAQEIMHQVEEKHTNTNTLAF